MTAIQFNLKYNYFINSYTVSSLCFKFIKTCYCTESKNTINTYILFLILSSHSFRGLENLMVF
jgi:hypothetical protein